MTDAEIDALLQQSPPAILDQMNRLPIEVQERVRERFQANQHALHGRIREIAGQLPGLKEQLQQIATDLPQIIEATLQQRKKSARRALGLRRRVVERDAEGRISAVVDEE